MSEMLKWAEEVQTGRYSGWNTEIGMAALARAILADTSPASQERDEAAIADEPDMYANQEVGDLVWLCSHLAKENDPKVWRDRKAARDRILARLRSGSEPGDVEVNPYRNGWTGEAAARPSGGEGVKWVEHGAANLNPERWEGYTGVGGEGAPEPDDRVILKRLYGAAIGNAGVYPSSEWTDCATKDYRYLLDRLPPEREACSTCTEGAPPYFCRECVHRREEKLREALEREAEALEAAVSLMADREAEIRADERRKVLDEARSAPSFIPVHGGEQRRLMATADQQLARLSPTDEQESPNRSDEP